VSGDICDSWRRFSHEARLCQGREHRRRRGLRRDLDDRRESSRNPERHPRADTSWMAFASCAPFSHAGRLCQRADSRQIGCQGWPNDGPHTLGRLGRVFPRRRPEHVVSEGLWDAWDACSNPSRIARTRTRIAWLELEIPVPSVPTVPDLRRAAAIPNTPNRGTARSAIASQGPRLRGERVSNLRARTAL